MQQRRADEAQVAGYEPGEEPLLHKRTDKEEGVFERRKPERGCHEVDQRIYRLVDIATPEDERRCCGVFREFLYHSPENDRGARRAVDAPDKSLKRNHERHREHPRNKRKGDHPPRLRALAVFMEPEPEPEESGEKAAESGVEYG